VGEPDRLLQTMLPTHSDFAHLASTTEVRPVPGPSRTPTRTPHEHAYTHTHTHTRCARNAHATLHTLPQCDIVPAPVLATPLPLHLAVLPSHHLEFSHAHIPHPPSPVILIVMRPDCLNRGLVAATATNYPWWSSLHLGGLQVVFADPGALLGQSGHPVFWPQDPALTFEWLGLYVPARTGGGGGTAGGSPHMLAHLRAHCRHTPFQSGWWWVGGGGAGVTGGGEGAAAADTHVGVSSATARNPRRRPKDEVGPPCWVPALLLPRRTHCLCQQHAPACCTVAAGVSMHTPACARLLVMEQVPWCYPVPPPPPPSVAGTPPGPAWRLPCGTCPAA
jgi:hypothetical protein